jgi:hypothetical protein
MSDLVASVPGVKSLLTDAVFRVAIIVVLYFGLLAALRAL